MSISLINKKIEGPRQDIWNKSGPQTLISLKHICSILFHQIPVQNNNKVFSLYFSIPTPKPKEINLTNVNSLLETEVQ